MGWVNFYKYGMEFLQGSTMPLCSYLQTFGADLQKLYFHYQLLKDENGLKEGLPRWRDFEDSLTRQHQLNAEWIQYKYLIEEQGLME